MNTEQYRRLVLAVYPSARVTSVESPLMTVIRLRLYKVWSATIDGYVVGRGASEYEAWRKAALVVCDRLLRGDVP